MTECRVRVTFTVSEKINGQGIGPHQEVTGEGSDIRATREFR